MASAGSPVTHLNRQYGIFDSLIYDDELGTTKYWYRGYTTERPKHQEYKDLLPVTRDIAFGGTPTIFEVPLYADKVGPMQLMWTASPITHTLGTFWRYSDFLALAAIDKIVLRFGSNIVETILPFKKFWKVMKHLSSEKRATEEEMLIGLKAAATRDALADGVLNPAGQEVIFDLHFSFTLSPDRYQEIRQLAIAPQIEVYWNRLAQFIETDAPTGSYNATISNLLLRQTNIYLEPDERDANTMATEKNHGIVRLREEHTLETPFTQRVPIGTTGVFQYEIKNQKSSLRFIALALRPQNAFLTDATAIPPTTARPYSVGDFYNGWVRFRLILGSGEVIFDWVTRKHNELYMHKKYYHGPPGLNMMFYTWDDNPMDELNAHGAYNFQGLQNPIIEIDFGAVPTPQELAVSVLYSQFNMHQTVKGEMNKQFQ